MSKITKLIPPKDWSMYFVAGDFHDEHACEQSISILCKHAQMIPKKRRKLILNGDIIDLPEFMPKNPDYKFWIRQPDRIEEYFLPAAQKACVWANDFLDRMSKVFSEIIFKEGNHDWRLLQFQPLAPNKYRDDFELKKQLFLRERKIKHVHYNHWIDIGNISITHGMYHGATACKKHYEASGRSVLFNHVHQFECKSFTRRGDTVMSWSNGAMCDLAPEYLRGRENNWAKGYSTIAMKKNGNFNLHQHAIWDGELILPTGETVK